MHTGEAGTGTAEEQWKTVWSQMVNQEGSLRCLCHQHPQRLSEQTSLLVAITKGEKQVLREKCRVCQAEITAGGFKKIK